MAKLIFLFFCLLQTILTVAQQDSTSAQIKVSGYIDIFYVYDFNNPPDSYRQSFFYNHNRHQEVNLNLGYIKASIEHPRYRANVTLQAGTYPQDNYAHEPVEYRHIFEANAGVSLNKKSSVWLDAGIFTSHIGFESAISSQNWTLTRSLVAENSPYYLTGVKFTHTPSDYLSLSFLVCNGWQRIQRLSGNSLPGFGTQVYFEKDELVFNWNTFVGTDDPDSTRRIRFFNNIYGHWSITEKAGLTLGFDVGLQQESKESSSYNFWYSPVAIFRHVLSHDWSYAIRGEYYADPTQIIITTGTANGFKTVGISLNLDYKPFAQLLCRIEARWLKSSDLVFAEGNSLSDSNVFITSSIAVTLN